MKGKNRCGATSGQGHGVQGELHSLSVFVCFPKRTLQKMVHSIGHRPKNTKGKGKQKHVWLTPIRLRNCHVWPKRASLS